MERGNGSLVTDLPPNTLRIFIHKVRVQELRLGKVVNQIIQVQYMSSGSPLVNTVGTISHLIILPVMGR